MFVYRMLSIKKSILVMKAILFKLDVIQKFSQMNIIAQVKTQKHQILFEIIMNNVLNTRF